MESKLIVSPNDTKRWYNEDGQLHRERGPAVIWPDGAEEWWLNGQLHRDVGPAVILLGGEEWWYRNDKLHREDGPAVIWADSAVEWFLNGKDLSFKEWADKLNIDQKARLEMVMRWNPD